MSVVLVVAPHPDDETLGCGGAILKHKKSGDQVHWLIMTNISIESGYSSDRVSSRSNEIQKVRQAYGFDSLYQTDFTTAMLDRIPRQELVGEISRYIEQVKPNILYVPYRYDIHSDHKVVFDAVAACTKSFRYPSISSVRAYETLSETEFSIVPGGSGFQPNFWIDVGDFIEEKIKIMGFYEGEMGAHPFPRSAQNIRALATFRGASVDKEAAEAFMLLKEIW